MNTLGTSPAKGELILVRHGQASLGAGDYDQLSPLGYRQIELLRSRIDLELGESWTGLHGTHRRHHQSMEGLVRGQSVTVDDGLNEYRVSSLVEAALADGSRLNIPPLDSTMLAEPKKYLPEFMAWFPAVLAAWQEGRLEDEFNGPWSRFHDRVRKSAEKLSAAVNAGQRMLVVSSAGTISTLLAELAGRDLAWQRTANLSLYNCAVCRLASGPNGWELDVFNCVRHLGDDDGLHTLA